MAVLMTTQNVAYFCVHCVPKEYEQGLKAFDARPEGASRPGLKGLKALMWKAVGKNVP